MSFRVLWTFAVAVLLAGASIGAQQRDTSATARTSVISGSVYDSVARAPLRGASIQIVMADNPAQGGANAITDSAGRFSLPPVAAGDHRRAARARAEEDLAISVFDAARV